MSSKIIIITIVVLIALIGAGLGFTGFFAVNQSQPQVAKLVIDSGVVQVKHTGEDWKNGENGMALKESDSVRTLSGSRASIIFFESSIVRLNENTEITIKELNEELGNRKIGLKQDSGRVWSTILKLSGVEEYEIETPTTVASIRGTSFDSWMRKDDKTVISLYFGRITVETYVLENNQRAIQALKDLASGTRIVADPARLDTLKIEPIVIDDWIRENIRLDEEFIALVSPQEARPVFTEEQPLVSQPIISEPIKKSPQEAATSPEPSPAPSEPAQTTPIKPETEQSTGSQTTETQNTSSGTQEPPPRYPQQSYPIIPLNYVYNPDNSSEDQTVK